MKLLTLVEGETEALVPHAARLGLTAVEVRMRANVGRPALLARLGDAEATALVTALGAAGLRALALDEAIPGPDARAVARAFTFGPEAVSFELAPAGQQALRYADLGLLLRGVRVRRASTTAVESERKFNLGKALLTQGLSTTSTVKREVQKVEENAETVLLACDRSGAVVELAESRLTYTGLPPPLEPSRSANLQRVARELRARAPKAIYDERLLQLGRRPLAFALPGNPDPFDVYAEMLRKALLPG